MRPMHLISWGFRQLGATGRTSASTKSPIGRYVIVKIVDVHRLDVSRGKLIKYCQESRQPDPFAFKPLETQGRSDMHNEHFREKVTRTLMIEPQNRSSRYRPQYLTYVSSSR